MSGAAVSGINLTLTQPTISGSVNSQSGTPIENATVELSVSLKPNVSSATNQLDNLSNPIPKQYRKQTQTNFQLLGESGSISQNSGRYALIYKQGDLGQSATDTANLKNPLWHSVPAHEQVNIIIGNPNKDCGGFLGAGPENEYDRQVPGCLESSGTVVVERLTPTGEVADGGHHELSLDNNNKQQLLETEKVNYASFTPTPGIYRVTVKPKSSDEQPLVYYVKAGSPRENINKYLENANEQLSERAQQVRDALSQNTLQTIRTKTDANGNWSVNVPANAKVATITARKASGVNVSPKNLTEANISTAYSSSPPNASLYYSDDTERVEPPASNVTLTMTEVPFPSNGDLGAYQNLTDRFWSLMQNNSYSEAAALIKQNLGKIDDPQKRKILQQLLVIAENRRASDKFEENSGRTIRKVVKRVENGNVENLNATIQNMSETIAELRSNIENGTPTSSTSSNAVSLTFPFETDLNAEQVSVLVHHSNGTTQPLSPENSSYVSIEDNIGGDAVKITDYPMGDGDAAVANFDVVVANEEGVGKASKRVKNPTYNGTIPGLKGIDLSTLRPGPNETVSMTLHPDADAKYRNLTSMTVYGPNGGTVPVTITGGKTATFDTDGKGIYHARVTYTNLDGKQFTTSFQIEAGENDREMPTGVRVVESVVGTLALTGDGLDAGSVSMENGGSKMSVVAQVGQQADAPSELHVYTTGVSLPPDTTLDVRVVRGDQQQSLSSQTVAVTVHLADLPDDALIYRNEDQPLPQGSSSSYGTVKDRNGHTVINTFTSDSGAVSLRTNANPSLVERAIWTVRTRLPSLPDIPTGIGPVAPGLPLASGAAAIIALRRRNHA